MEICVRACARASQTRGGSDAEAEIGCINVNWSKPIRGGHPEQKPAAATCWQYSIIKHSGKSVHEGNQFGVIY